MTKNKSNIITVSIVIIVLILIIIGLIVNIQSKIQKEEIEFTINLELPEFYYKSPKEGLKEALKFYEIKDDSVVYAIAKLETGNFTSRLCNEDNNLFGLYNSKTYSYFKFKHWTESVEAYKTMVEYKRKPNENIYSFLDRITYAEDSMYLIKLRKIVKSL